MAMVQVNNLTYETALIAFDKDGTLIDLHRLWGSKMEQWVDALLHKLGEDEMIRSALYQSLGYAPITKQVSANSPLAVASMAKLYTVVATILYQQGIPWHEAEQLAQKTASTTISAPPHSHQIIPIGDVYGTMHRLAVAGIKIAIITTDDRTPTEETLALLGIKDVVDILICGDDDLPGKPDPAGFHFLSQKYTLDVSQMMMVGDSANDMLFGKNAGVACCVGINNGQDDRLSEPAFADMIVPSIEAIQIV